MPVHPIASSEFSTAPERPDQLWMEAVWQVVAGIPAGMVLTYGEVARLAGAPGWARQVAPALNRAPASLVLPWHRVINAQGCISLPADSPDGRRQRERLEEEGVEFRKGRIDLKRFGYQAAVDRLLWAPP